MLDHELIDTVSLQDFPNTFEACLNAHGVYTTEHFVLRLSPRVHSLISSTSNGIYAGGEVDTDVVQAYSTYLHETIHWWQHMGSTAGLTFSLAYPAQTYTNIGHIQSYIANTQPEKSIKMWAEKELRAGKTHEDLAVRAANSIVNNAIDIEYYKRFSFDPSCAETIINEIYFESVGHSYRMAYGQMMSMLSATFDPEFEYLPDARLWDVEFPKLEAKEHEGFYNGSPISRGRVGLRALFEGQARFCQLQYLNLGLGQRLTFAELEDQGYLSGIYVEAFDQFLEITDTERPEYFDDPCVGLFLLICDIALNPSAGFPLQIESYHNFILDVDPGIRFCNLCLVVAKEHPELRSMIKDHSQQEYLHISQVLTLACGYDHPMRTLEEVVKWVDAVPMISELMKEYETFNYGIMNLPVRLLFSHFLKYSKDKYLKPEFFVWPGFWMTGNRASETVEKLFLTHLSLFSDKEDDDGIFPRMFPDKDPEGIKTTFNAFYANNMVYDLTRQWILKDGDFEYDFSWLSAEHSKEDLEQVAKGLFEKIHAVNPDKLILA